MDQGIHITIFGHAGWQAKKSGAKSFLSRKLFANTNEQKMNI
jgi:hypothetical protein